MILATSCLILTLAQPPAAPLVMETRYLSVTCTQLMRKFPLPITVNSTQDIPEVHLSVSWVTTETGDKKGITALVDLVKSVRFDVGIGIKPMPKKDKK